MNFGKNTEAKKTHYTEKGNKKVLQIVLDNLQKKYSIVNTPFHAQLAGMKKVKLASSNEEKKMSYVDAFLDLIPILFRVVERKDGKDSSTNIKPNIHFIIKTNVANTKVFMVTLHVSYVKTPRLPKELAINKSKELFESDVNPILPNV